jgi:hypothetical protein
MARKQGNKWIQRAIKKPGALTAWAKRHGIQPPFSMADLQRLRRIAQRIKNPEVRTRMLRRINLARTLKRISKSR